MHTIARAAARLIRATARRVAAAARHGEENQEDADRDGKVGRRKKKELLRQSKNKQLEIRVENVSDAAELVPSLTRSSVNIFTREVQ